MPKQPLKDAFANHALSGTYDPERNGNAHKARILPVTREVAETYDLSSTRTENLAGRILVSWNNGDKREGKILMADASNDLMFEIPRNDGTKFTVSGRDMRQAIVSLATEKNRARDNAAEVVASNEQAALEYEAARDRGEAAQAPTPREPDYASDAFKNVQGLVTCVMEVMSRNRESEFATTAMKTDIDGFMGRMTKILASGVSPEDKAKIDEMRQIRAEIGVLSPDHENASASRIPAPYQGDGEAAREMSAKVPYAPPAIDAETAMAAGRNIDMDLARRLFSVATTTPLMSIQRHALSHEGGQTLIQDLERHENREAGAAVIARMQAVTREAMPTYRWEGTLFTKDDADVLVMRDGISTFAYIWDAESRVNDIDVDAALIGNYAPEDVPSDETLAGLRQTLEALRYDNNADIDFGFGEDDEDPVID